MKICIVSSCGGHLTEVRRLMPAYKDYEHFYVLDGELLSLPADMQGRTYFVSHSERDLKLLLNLWQAFRILRQNKPQIIISTGASPAVPFALLGRLLFGTRVLFIETITRVDHPSLTGRIMYLIAHNFLYQWEPLRRYYPSGTYGGPLL